MTSRALAAFRKDVWKYFKVHGRHDLPWRKTKDAYRIMVSEVMLQQTQVPRVAEKYKEFLRAFPTVRSLSRAKLSEVLRVWSGLGYNRRGKYLHDAARIIISDFKADMKKATARRLPGMGPYTKAAVRVFAYNEPHNLLETNIRTVYIHHFFADTPIVDDRTILVYAKQAAKGQDPRKWHWALMDYGVHLKKLHKNPSRKSAHYTKQSKFEGSLRQVRGAILKAIHEMKSVQTLPYDKDRKDKALASLERDGLVKKEKGKWRIA